MAYAGVDDMISRFGATEMVRLTTPSDQDMDGVVASVAYTALKSASAFMDGYIGRRYQVPMDVAPAVVVDHCCDIARFKLSTGDQKTCSEEVRSRHQDAVRWLEKVSVGQVVLELDEVATGDESYAEACTGRDAVFGHGGY